MAQYQYFIKRLGSQEMGSRRTREDCAKRGRYILIPNLGAQLFPLLSDTQENDNAFLGFTPVFRTGNNSSYPPKCYLDYVYHNSKVVYHQQNGRNEKRIYLSTKLDQGEFFQGDIVVIRRRIDSSNSSSELDDDKFLAENDLDDFSTLKNGFEYYIDWIRQDIQPEEWSIYDQWINVLQESKGRSAVIINDKIEIFENKIANVCPNGVVVDERIIRDFPDVETVARSNPNNTIHGLDSYAKLFNTQSFRSFVLTTYGNTCAVTQEAISYGELNNLEAAHIHPKCHGGYFLPQNGIAMRRDIHWAFDKGMFYIDPQTRTVHVHKLVQNSYLGRYEGTVIRPKTEQFAPLPEYLEYHRKNIFGSFLYTGSIKNIC